MRVCPRGRIEMGIRLVAKRMPNSCKHLSGHLVEALENEKSEDCW